MFFNCFSIECRINKILIEVVNSIATIKNLVFFQGRLFRRKIKAAGMFQVGDYIKELGKIN